MKISYIIIFLILSFNVLGMELQSSEYNSGDTLIVSSSENLYHSQAKVIDNSGNDQHIGILGYNAGNLSLIYFDIPLWMKGNYTLLYNNSTFKFQVFNGQSLSIRPIVMQVDEHESTARIDLKNILGNTAYAAVSSENPEITFSRDAITIPGSSTRSVYLSFLPGTLDGYTVTVSYNSGKRSYAIPIIVSKEQPQNGSVNLVNVVEPQEKPNMQTNLQSLKIVENLTSISHTVPRTKMINGSLHFVSSRELRNAQFHLTTEVAEIVTLNITSYEIMLPNHEYEQYLWINKYRNFPEGEYTGLLSLDTENGDTVNISLSIKLTATNTESSVKTPQKNITRKTFNVTEGPNINFTTVNYTEEARIEKERRDKNLRFGLLLSGGLLLVISILIYLFRPKPKELKFREYVGQFKKGSQKK